MKLTFDNNSDRSIYGAIPKPTALPNPRADLQATGFDVNRINPALSEGILSDLSGVVDYEPSMSYAAAAGIRSGMPTSEFAQRTGAADYLNRVQAAKQRGQTNALNAMGVISNTQTVRPETQIALDQANKVLESAPDPASAARNALSQYQSALDRASSYFSAPRQQSGGGRSMFDSAPIQRGFPTPTPSGGLVTSDDPFNWNPGGFGQATAAGGSGWNDMAFGGGGAQTASGGMPNPGLVVNDVYSDDFYKDLADYYNPGIWDSGTDWSQFE
jgi:hypothetical protein